MDLQTPRGPLFLSQQSGACDSCMGRGTKIVSKRIGEHGFPDDYIPGVSKITQIQVCRACNGTGRKDKRNIDREIEKLYEI